MTSRTDAGVGGEVDGGSRESLEGRARAGAAMGGGVLALSGRFERSDGFVPITEATRGPADKRAPYDEWSGRALAEAVNLTSDEFLSGPGLAA